MNWLQAFYVSAIGACLGSFMNVLIYRLPRGLSAVTPPSSCTSCGERIMAYDNIPVLSWFILRGRCRFCGAKLSFMYPLSEILTGALFFLCFLKFGLGWQMWLGCAVIFFGLAAALTDLFTALDTENFECGIIPDSIVFTGLGAGAILSYIVTDSVTFPLYGAAAGFLGLFVPSYLFKIIRKKEGMGGGDIKLMAMFGAMLGIKSVFFLIFGSALIGAVVGIIAGIVLKQKNMMVPFGPFITLTSILYLFFGSSFDTFLYGI